MHTPLRSVIHIRRFSTIEPKPLDWLWHLRIPIGKLTLLAGDPATGKTSLLLDLASRLSTSKPMPPTPQSPPFATARAHVHSQPAELSLHAPSPDPESRTPDPEQNRQPQATLLLSPEDNAADTLRPKLDRLGADPTHIHTLPELHSLSDPTASTHPETHQPLTALEYLEAAIQSIPNLALLIIDPITYYLGLTDKSLRYRAAAQSARPRSTLHSLALLAQKHHLAIVLTTRLAKKIPEKDPSLASLRRALGSLAFTSAARSVLLTLPHTPTTTTNTTITTNSPPPTHLLLSIKSNLTDPPPPLAFTLTDQITWEASAPVIPETTPPKKPLTRAELNEKSLVADAVRFLHQFLSDGPKKATTVQSHASDLGISPSSLRRARIHLDLPCKFSRKRNAWFLSLPTDSRPIPSEMQELENALRISGNLEDLLSNSNEEGML